MQARSLLRQIGVLIPIHVSLNSVCELQRMGFIRDHHKAKAFAPFKNQCLLLSGKRKPPSGHWPSSQRRALRVPEQMIHEYQHGKSGLRTPGT